MLDSLCASALHAQLNFLSDTVKGEEEMPAWLSY